MSRHYTSKQVDGDEAWEVLKRIFPEATADTLNFVLFSTSGVHGSYITIEDIESDEDFSESDLTYLVIHPRMVSTVYGNLPIRTPEDFEYLKNLRKSSHEAIQKIGMPGDIS